MSHIRLEENGDIAGPYTRVVYIDSDGTETDISNVVTAVTYSGKVGDANRATIDLIKVRGHITARLTDVVVADLTPRKWWRRWRDVSAFGRATKTYVKA